MKRLLLPPLLVLALVSPSTPAQAGAETLHFGFKGLFASASFTSTDPSGCVVTNVFVLGTEDRTKSGPGHPVAESLAILGVSQSDICAGKQLLAAAGSATLAADELRIDRQLTAAALTTTVDSVDSVSGSSFPVDIGVSWTGVGVPVSDRHRFHQNSPGFKVNARFAGISRGAAASGSILIGTTNLTPEPAFFAEMGSIKVGEVDIVRM